MSKLKPIADGIYGVETTFAVAPGVHLPLRMTVVVDSDGVTLVCPIAIDDALAKEIVALGEVRRILATNCFHYAYLQAASKHFPEASVLGAPGLAEKRPKLPLSGVLEPGQVSDELVGYLVDGAVKMSEVVLLHKRTGTLIVTDLVFNVHGLRGWSKFVLGVVSRCLGRVEQSRLVRTFTNDRAAAGRSVEALLGLPFDRLVMAHGEVVETGGVAQLRRGTWWMRGESKLPQAA